VAEGLAAAALDAADADRLAEQVSRGVRKVLDYL
jgi:hypothetical protein